MPVDRSPDEIPPWRESPFVPGLVYRVRKSFPAFIGTFEAGELLTFVGDAWSRYDEMTGYFFRDASGRDRRWDISDDDDIGRWVQLFEVVHSESV